MGIDAQTSLYAVWGYPVRHSFSPRIFNRAFAAHGINAVYLAQEVSPVNLPAAVAGARALGLAGWNLTLPHKQAVIALVDAIEPRAARIGAVNAIVRESDGRLVGHNTDAAGFLGPLAERTGFDPRGRTALLLGTGGAARAIAFGLAEAGIARLRLRNRTLSRAEALAEELRAQPGAPEVDVGPLQSDLPAADWHEVDLVVQGTSLGLHGATPPLPDWTALPTSAILADIVYGGEPSAWLKAGEAARRATFDGLWMLIGQAALTYELWTGRSFTTAEARRWIGEGATG